MVKNLLNLFFPQVCEACNSVLSDNEFVICLKCRHQLPVTNFHFEDSDDVKKILYGRVKLENATALFHFAKKSIVQNLLHNLKYRGHEQIGEVLGKWLGGELKTIDAYKTINCVIPVPLYKTKLRKRGYNQVTRFGKAIAQELNVEFNDKLLIKTKPTKTQVFKGRFGRSENNKAVFDLSKDQNFNGKHILIVDDIITTGATIESCAAVLLKFDNIKLSLATMAIAD